MTQASLDAHPRYLLATDIAAFAVGVVVVIALGFIPRIFSPLALVLMVIGLGALLGLDLLLWHLAGIRSLRLQGEDLTLHKGAGREEVRVQRSAVVSLRVVRRLGKRTAVLRMTSGKQVRVAEDAFPREGFARFLAALEEWARAPRGLRRR